jgi:hypothetical protein
VPKRQPVRDNAKPISDGHHTVTPYLVLDDAAPAIEFHAAAFDAREEYFARGCSGPQGV